MPVDLKISEMGSVALTAAAEFPLIQDGGNYAVALSDIASFVLASDANILSWAGVTRASGFDAFAATPSSANLRTLVTDETGSGSLVFATSPTLVSPVLGAATATSIAVTNSSGTPGTFTNTQNTAFATTLVVEGDRSAPAANDDNVVEYRLSDSAGNQDPFLRFTTRAITVTSGAEVGQVRLALPIAGTLTTQLLLSNNVLSGNANDVLVLGATSLGIADIFLASGAVLNWANGNFTITHNTGVLDFAGGQVTFTSAVAATSAVRSINTTDNANVQGLRIEGDRATPTNSDIVYASFFLSDSVGTQTEFARIGGWATVVTDGAEVGRLRFDTLSGGSITNRMVLFNTALYPAMNDGLSLGQAALGWSDIFFASGGVINWNNGNATLTHSTGRIASNVPVGLAAYTVAALPAGSTGDIAYASDGRKNGEGAAAGTGVMVFKDGTAWRACDTGATVAA